MRLPWGNLDWMNSMISKSKNSTIAILGCLSFEDRCMEAVKRIHLSGSFAAKPHFLEVHDPLDAFPNHSDKSRRLIKRNLKSLKSNGINPIIEKCNLLATEDQLLDLLNNWDDRHSADIVILDISSFPKRYFCFLLKQLLQDNKIERLILIYTETGQRGYPLDHLCEDPMPRDHLPGFSASIPPYGGWLVVAIGFETLNISSIVHDYRDPNSKVKFLHSFPPSLHVNRRQWSSLLEIESAGSLPNVATEDIEVVSLWDSEQVYRRLVKWQNECISSRCLSGNRDVNSNSCLALAPFGSKPHTLGMALFAIKNRCGMYYTQPKSYNPSYSSGFGKSWSYVVKWDGIPCINREVLPP